jgi:hypothetical protein
LQDAKVRYIASPDPSSTPLQPSESVRHVEKATQVHIS